MYRVRSPTWVDDAILWTVMWYQLHDVQTNASLARPYDLLEFSKKLTNNNSKQIEMNETELKSYKKIITAKNLLIKAIKLLNLRKKPMPIKLQYGHCHGGGKFGSFYLY